MASFPSGAPFDRCVIHTLVLTDVATGWTESMPLVVREATLVVEAIERLRPALMSPPDSSLTVVGSRIDQLDPIGSAPTTDRALRKERTLKVPAIRVRCPPAVARLMAPEGRFLLDSHRIPVRGNAATSV